MDTIKVDLNQLVNKKFSKNYALFIDFKLVQTILTYIENRGG